MNVGADVRCQEEINSSPDVMEKTAQGVKTEPLLEPTGPSGFGDGLVKSPEVS